MTDAWKEWLRDLKYDEETDEDGPVYGYAAEALAEIEKLETRAEKAEAVLADFDAKLALVDRERVEEMRARNDTLLALSAVLQLAEDTGWFLWREQTWTPQIATILTDSALGNSLKRTALPAGQGPDFSAGYRHAIREALGHLSDEDPRAAHAALLRGLLTATLLPEEEPHGTP